MMETLSLLPMETLSLLSMETLSPSNMETRKSNLQSIHSAFKGELHFRKILQGMLYISRCYFWCWNGKTKFENFWLGKSMSEIFLAQISWKLYMSENIKCGASQVNLSRISNFEKRPILGIVIAILSFFLQNL